MTRRRQPAASAASDPKLPPKEELWWEFRRALRDLDQLDAAHARRYLHEITQGIRTAIQGYRKEKKP